MVFVSYCICVNSILRKNIILLIAYLLIAYVLIALPLRLIIYCWGEKQYYIEVDVDGFDNDWYLIDGKDTIDELKDKIQAKNGIPLDQQRIVFMGKQVYEGTLQQLVADAGEMETARVKFVCELTGGGNNIQINMEAFWAHRTQ